VDDGRGGKKARPSPRSGKRGSPSSSLVPSSPVDERRERKGGLFSIFDKRIILSWREEKAGSAVRNESIYRFP